jgi:ABC-type nitrate/sulfonate/bicarbonate transport system substrate-binding protein
MTFAAKLKTALAAACLTATASFASLAAEKLTIGTGVDPSFGSYYVAKQAGIFEKNGLDVQLNTGPSGSAMVSFVIKNQIQSAFGAEQAGIQAFNIDPDVVLAAEGGLMRDWYGLVARGYDSIEQLKGKKIGVARGSGSEVFWLAMVDKLKLNPKDYNIVQVEAPEMVAALERGNIDAFTSWEPWLTRTVRAIPNTKLIVTNEGIMSPRVFIYLNRAWAEKNRPAAEAFIRSLVEATEIINKKPDEAETLVSTYLKLDKDLTKVLLGKVRADIRLDQDSIKNFQLNEQQLKDMGKLAKPIDWQKFIYDGPLKAVRPDAVKFEMPK